MEGAGERASGGRCEMELSLALRFNVKGTVQPRRAKKGRLEARQGWGLRAGDGQDRPRRGLAATACLAAITSVHGRTELNLGGARCVTGSNYLR
ncbi:hypothetical protein N656DRAFT_331154 [Canariomyces notabilis]|uniref:Uncharacterized protein n=1 Tax=Canariomyces notabilis TaxID=2074819 RepID=A0AAN6QG48_9PEZI|nr:hypothetical protein N656DRAFT_331154 [Canariomyces arenarius]